MDADTLPTVIRAAREKAGLTQQELADKIGCHPTTVVGWESDRDRRKGGGGLYRALKLAAVLRLNPRKLLASG